MRVLARTAGTLLIITLAGAGCGREPGTRSTAGTSDAASSAISSSPASVVKGTPLTTAQALVLSRMLLNDHDAGGADVSVRAPAGAMPAFEMRGTVDWLHHQGRVTVHFKGAASQPDEVLVWSDANLFIAVPGLGDAMAAKGRQGITFASRPLQSGTTTLDQVIVLVSSLASDRAENPILLRQADTGYLGPGEIDGVQHERFRYGATVYWVEPAERIGRVEATLRTTGSAVVIDLTDHGARQVGVPAADGVVPAAEITDVLSALVRN